MAAVLHAAAWPSSSAFIPVSTECTRSANQVGVRSNLVLRVLLVQSFKSSSWLLGLKPLAFPKTSFNAWGYASSH